VTAAALYVFQSASARVMFLSPVDLIIISLYFGLVLGLGLYLRHFTTTGEEIRKQGGSRWCLVADAVSYGI